MGIFRGGLVIQALIIRKKGRDPLRVIRRRRIAAQPGQRVHIRVLGPSVQLRLNLAFGKIFRLLRLRFKKRRIREESLGHSFRVLARQEMRLNLHNGAGGQVNSLVNIHHKAYTAVGAGEGALIGSAGAAFRRRLRFLIGDCRPGLTGTQQQRYQANHQAAEIV